MFTRAVDGAELHFEVEGEGPAVVLSNGLANDAFQWKALRKGLAGRAKVVTWDYRGHGRSQPARDLQRLSVADLAADLEQVLDAAGVERAALLGYSMGSQVVFEAWRRLPQRVTALVSVLGGAGRVFDGAAGPRAGKVIHRLLRRVPDSAFAANLVVGSRLSSVVHRGAQVIGMFEPHIAHDDFADWYSHLGSIHAPTFRALTLGLQDHDAFDLLPGISVPTLVLSGGRDLFVRPGLGRKIAAAIPGAEYAEYPEATHAGLVGHAAEIPPRILQFLEQRQLIA
ncbi:MAG TPA: alpha/beta fold hydrolase [Myxococcota bacterium]|nr:alpha/beta fold hydrolase [Myxococcota bacterium]HND28418.1 alpha/beta fold hydrolase [Myxococcota bacterium]